MVYVSCSLSLLWSQIESRCFGTILSILFATQWFVVLVVYSFVTHVNYILFFKFFNGDYISGINNHLKTIWDECDKLGMIVIVYVPKSL
jgi:hypothetical protein